MSAIIVNRNGNVISGSCNGVPYSIPFSESKYQAMKELADKARNPASVEELRFYVKEFELLTKENYADFVETKSPYIKVNKDTNKFYLQYEGVISSQAMPNNMAQRILKAAEKDLDILPVVKCWVRFLHCPVYSPSKAERFAAFISLEYVSRDQVTWLQTHRGLSEVMAVQFSTTPQVSLTVEGLIVGYKVSKLITSERTCRLMPSKPKMILDEQTGLVKYDDKDYAEDQVYEPWVQGQGGDAFWCDDYLGHIIKVGRVHKVQSWKHINTNDNTGCVPGLHVGGLYYIEGYQESGGVTHNILVDPMHIGAVPDTRNDGGAIRVAQYFVLNAFNGVNKTLYHSSTYATMTDAKYKKLIKEAVEVSGARELQSFEV